MMPSSHPTAAAASASFSGEDIQRILHEKGNIVKAVLLRCPPVGEGNDGKKTPSTEGRRVKSEGEKEVAVDFGQQDVVNGNVECSDSPRDDVDKNDIPNSQDDHKTSATGAPLVASNLRGTTKESVVECAYNPSLESYIEEVEIDTTPKERAVAKLLTGDVSGRITFLGQYETENTVVIASSENSDNNTDNEAQKVDAKHVKRINPHQLQPPLHKWNGTVSGDILLMRVRPDDEDEEEFEAEVERQKEILNRSRYRNEEDARTEKAESNDSGVAEKDNVPESCTNTNEPTTVSSTESEPQGVSTSTEEKDDEEAAFFQDYTKETYISFAKRSDIPIPEEEEEESEDCDDEENESIALEGLTSENDDQQNLAEVEVADEAEDDEDDEEYDPEEDEDALLEESPMAMFHMVLGHLIRQFHEQNGRGPGSSELLRMRALLADRMGIELEGVTAVPSDEENSNQEDVAAADSDDAGGERSDEKPKIAEKSISPISTDSGEGASSEGVCHTTHSPVQTGKKRRREDADDADAKDECNDLPGSSNPKAKKRHKKRIHWNEKLFHVQEIPAHLPSSDESVNEDESETEETTDTTTSAIAAKEEGSTSVSCAPLDRIENFAELKPGEQEV